MGNVSFHDTTAPLPMPGPTPRPLLWVLMGEQGQDSQGSTGHRSKSGQLECGCRDYVNGNHRALRTYEGPLLCIYYLI